MAGRRTRVYDQRPGLAVMAVCTPAVESAVCLAEYRGACVCERHGCSGADTRGRSADHALRPSTGYLGPKAYMIDKREDAPL